MKTTIKQTLTRMHKKVINMPVSKNSAAGARPTGAVKVSKGVSQERHLQRPNPKTAFCKKKKKQKKKIPTPHFTDTLQEVTDRKKPGWIKVYTSHHDDSFQNYELSHFT